MFSVAIHRVSAPDVAENVTVTVQAGDDSGLLPVVIHFLVRSDDNIRVAVSTTVFFEVVSVVWAGFVSRSNVPEERVVAVGASNVCHTQ